MSKYIHLHNSLLRRLLLSASVIFFMLFGVITYLVKQDVLRTVDFALLVKIQNHIPLSLNPLFSLANSLGSFWISLVFLLVLTLSMKKTSHKLVLIGFFILAHIMELGLKLFLTQPGPPFQFHRFATPYFFDKDYVIEGSSYFSGHTFRAIYLGLISIFQLVTTSKLRSTTKAMLSIIVWFLAATVITAKLAFGQHWVSDVIAGKMLGLSFSTFFLFLLIKSRKSNF